MWTLRATDQAKGGEVGELVTEGQIAQRRLVCEEGGKRDASTGSISAAERSLQSGREANADRCRKIRHRPKLCQFGDALVERPCHGGFQRLGKPVDMLQDCRRCVTSGRAIDSANSSCRFMTPMVAPAPDGRHQCRGCRLPSSSAPSGRSMNHLVIASRRRSNPGSCGVRRCGQLQGWNFLDRHAGLKAGSR